MKEDFLHYVWKLKRFRFLNLKTSEGSPVEIYSTGTHNHHAGPDFLNARIRIDGQLWAGNVEIHVKSSDWYLHGHEKDNNYNNVILHVVWEDDIAVFRKDNTAIPALALKAIVSKTTIGNYKRLFTTNKRFINCEKHLASADNFVWQNWLERLYVERLEEKSEFIFRELKDSGNDWEAVLFRLLMKNFGLHINGAAFYSIAKAVDYSLIRKTGANPLMLEALFFGLAGFLDDAFSDRYKSELTKEYEYLKHKFRISDQGIISPKFFRLRPANFPTVRLSQFARLYSTHQHLFSEIIAATTPEAYYNLLRVTASEYWTIHYTFGKASSKKEKKLSISFMQLLIINTILPLKFCYSKHMGKDNNEELITTISALQPENNSIIEKYKALYTAVPSAMESQSLLQLYNNYCSKHKCLQCAVGNQLIGSGTE